MAESGCGNKGTIVDLKNLVGFYDPHMASAQAQLTARLDEANVALDPATLDPLRRYLLNALFNISYKVLVAHFKLVEATHSFEQFGASLCEPEVRQYFFNRYPVMHGWMDQITVNWADQSALLLIRFEADKHSIARALLNTEEAIAIHTIRLGMGDMHRGGRSVAQLELTNGDKLFYKPRSLAIDQHFADLVTWLNTLGGSGLRTPASMDCGDYGWVSFVSQQDCTDQTEIDDYYYRMGHWLAVLYVLEGTDFHYENIIAAGPHPILVDLESFFHPKILSSDDTADADNSVLSTGILPHYLKDGASHLPDLSGVADVEGAEGVLAELVLEEQGGNIVFVRKKAQLSGGGNVPRLNGKKVILGTSTVTALQQGFQAMYRLLAANKGDLRHRLAVFRNAEVRVLFRNTVTYRHLLDESTHPSLMRDWQDVRRHFGLLSLAIAENVVVEKFVRFEEADLLRHDVPLFTTRVDSRDLWYADGGIVPGFFRKSGLDGALEKIDLLSEQDMHNQNWMIAKSLQIAQDPTECALSMAPGVAGVYADAAQLRERARQEALRVAEYVITQMHVQGDHASWLIVRATSIDNRKMELLPAFHDLFAGMPGEIIFLETVAQMTGETRYADFAAKALNTLTFKLDHTQHLVSTVGMFSGWGGVLYMLAFLGTLKSDRGYFERAERYMEILDFDAMIGADKELGMIKGSVGFALACSELYLASGSQRAMELARSAGEHLLRNRHPGYPGFSWLTVSKVPLGGMAHGASGFATAFARLYEVTGESRYTDAALKSLDYERVLFSPTHQNWRDCRDIATQFSGGEHYTTTWAHGAPGVGLARVALLHAGIKSDVLLEELEIAVRTTLALQPCPSHAVISGSFGNIELLLASQPFLVPELAAQIFPAVVRLLQEVDVLDWNLREKAYRPLGMMTGVTGIGYQCLRIAYPEQVPSLLSCMTPRASATTAESSRQYMNTQERAA
jgi:type 2 lantibiotic biosynthesis protein LanM